MGQQHNPRVAFRGCLVRQLVGPDRFNLLVHLAYL
jgi:hypothetical protein